MLNVWLSNIVLSVNASQASEAMPAFPVLHWVAEVTVNAQQTRPVLMANVKIHVKPQRYVPSMNSAKFTNIVLSAPVHREQLPVEMAANLSVTYQFVNMTVIVLAKQLVSEVNASILAMLHSLVESMPSVRY